jgi:pimeloyl-ACP methyl ester carboxylesterase
MSRFLGIVRKLLLMSFAFAVAVVVSLAVWQAIASRIDRASLAPEGIGVDVHGHRVHVVLEGAETRGPTVVLECGIGGATAASWGSVRPLAAGFARVFSYDRAGLGASEPGPLPRDGARLAEELHEALHASGAPLPYVLVGHSYGGLIARLFVARYPSEVAGVVLIESSHPDQFGSMRPRTLRRIARAVRVLPWCARLGWVRAALAFIHLDADFLPQRERAEQRAYLASPEHWRGVVDELAEWDRRTNPEVRATGDLGSRPVVVLTASESARRFGAWQQRQAEIAKLSTDSAHHVISGATHGSLIADPRCARYVGIAIREVVDAVRAGRPLSDAPALFGE